MIMCISGTLVVHLKHYNYIQQAIKTFQGIEMNSFVGMTMVKKRTETR